MNFTAIDFETANEKRASACAIGMVKVKDGIIVDKKYSLLKPSPLRFTPFHSSFHGIEEKDVLSAPTFEEYAETIIEFIGDDYVVAHNASFEKGVLSQSFHQISQPMPDWTFLCTYRVAKHIWSDLLMYSLPDVCNHLNIPMSNHHHALSDAELCSQILLEATKQSSKDLATLRGEIYWDGKKTFSKVITSTTDDIDTSHLFYNKTIAITGTLSYPRREIVQILVNLGAKYHDKFKKNTNILITGISDILQFRDGNKSIKLKTAEVYKSEGVDIELIDESQFWQMV